MSNWNARASLSQEDQEEHTIEVMNLQNLKAKEL